VTLFDAQAPGGATTLRALLDRSIERDRVLLERVGGAER
jgi:hypothetical protein